MSSDSPRLPNRRRKSVRVAMLAGGFVLIAASPIVGLTPGPGGIFLFAGGLALVLRGSRRAKRRYVELKRRWPKLGRIADKAMRRPSIRRREARLEAAAD